jgi:hypothetical protein
VDDAISARLEESEHAFAEIEKSLLDPEVVSDHEQLAVLGK